MRLKPGIYRNRIGDIVEISESTESKPGVFNASFVNSKDVMYSINKTGMVYKSNESILDIVEYIDPKKYPEYYI
jgi:hypothetical protein